MKSFKISIITINYNNSKGLEKTIRSVLSQTYTNIEYIVIDGCSTDGSIDVLKVYESSLFYVLSEPDSGVYEAMNKGIQKATGDYLLFLNSGDVLSDSKILNSFVNHSNFKGDIVYGDYLFNNGEKQYPDNLTPLFFMRTSLPHQSTLFKKTIFEKIGGYNESFRISADRDFYLKCFLSEQFIFNRVPVALTLFDLSGISNNKEYFELKRNEDERLFKENFGIYYEDYKQLIVLAKELDVVKTQTIRGVMKRVKNKFISICRVP